MRVPLIIVLASLLGAVGCTDGRKSMRNFRLPEGDATRGQAAFVALKCHVCHPVSGVDLPAPTADPANILALGGEVIQLRTYGDLLTAIIHPAYELSDKLTLEERRRLRTSPMTPVNQVMTVSQLVDLVAFLQPRYRPLQPLYGSQYQLVP